MTDSTWAFGRLGVGCAGLWQGARQFKESDPPVDPLRVRNGAARTKQLGRTRRAGLLAALIAVLVVLGGLPVAAAPMGTGSVSGRVIDADGNPISGICANIDNGPGAQTDGTGAYVITGLDSGTYKMYLTDCNPTPQFVTQWYLGRTDAGSGDPVSVIDTTNTTLADVTMIRGVSVTGTVTDTNGTPLAGMTVNVDAAGSGSDRTVTQTDALGVYTTVPLTPGDYKARFSDPTSTPTYATEYWNQKPTWSTSDTVTLNVTNGRTQSGIDAHLSVGASISGTVHDTSANPLPSICVDANALNQNGGSDWISGTTTDPSGAYTLVNLPATDVRVHFRDCNSGPYIDQWYDGQSDPDSSTPVVLGAGDVRTGVNASLVQGVKVAGTVTDSDGNPIAGISVNVNPTGNGSSTWGQTDSSGHYTTGGLPAGTYKVQFRDPGPTPQWAGQYWNGKTGYNAATVLTLTLADAPERDGVDATLVRGATVSGTVTGPDGGPAANVCVNAQVTASDGGPDWAGNTTTGNDGTYTLGGLPATQVKIQFQDCNGTGPYVEQYWKNQSNFGDATGITLTAGATRTGVDARLAAAAQITGTVTDRAGHPLQGICAQASTSTAVGNLASTDHSGVYRINLAHAGRYKVQFVDCNDTTRYAGQWWNDQPTAATAQTIVVAAGQTVGHVDAALRRGTAGSISGKVVNLHGVAVTAGCVIAFLPDKFARFGMVGSDGTYTIPDVPSGAFALAFLGCSGGDPTATVKDPQAPSVSYQGAWWLDAPVVLTNSSSPDPIAQRATLVTMTPGQRLTGYDHCFGCSAIAITKITPGTGSLTVSFTTPGMASGAPGSLAPQGNALTYTVTCTSTTGGVTGSASGPSSPITVTGLTPGESYTCHVTGSSGAVTVAASSGGVAVVSASSSGADPSGESASAPSSASSTPTGVVAEMARTGANSAMQALLGAGSLALGLALIAITRSRRPLVCNTRGDGNGPLLDR